MKIDELSGLLGARCAQDKYENGDIAGAYTSDLLSDAMANAVEHGVLVTIQAHKNTVAVGTLKDLAAIVVCNDRPIPDDMVEAAREEGIAIFVTALSQYAVSGRLWGVLGE